MANERGHGVSAERGAVAQPPRITGQKEVTVQLTDRLILSQFAAKRPIGGARPEPQAAS